MIPGSNIAEWRSVVPWTTNEQVERDLIISRVTCPENNTVEERDYRIPEPSRFIKKGREALDKIQPLRDRPSYHGSIKRSADHCTGL